MQSGQEPVVRIRGLRKRLDHFVLDIPSLEIGGWWGLSARMVPVRAPS